MFSKSKINDPIETREVETPSASASSPRPSSPAPTQGVGRPGPKPAPSIISADLTITGNLVTTGDMQVEGTIEGDIRSHLLTIGQSATVRGEIVADDVVVNGRVIGRIRGQKVRLSSTAQVEGDIVHKTIAIEAGADFQGSVKRSDDPLGTAGGEAMKAITGPSSSL